ncbi:MAG TPA: rod shape-determining protein MreD [Rhodospirillaceae bacterium]|nr:rod shape-determining protein MreD [Rhodospirillaceae bacterium]
MKGTLLQRMDQGIRQFVPVGLTLLLILLDAMPARLPGYAPVSPLLPIISVYYWSFCRPDLLPPAVAFALGLVNDVIMGSPLGVSSLVYLLVQGMTLSQRRLLSGRPFMVGWLGFLVIGSGAIALQWSMISMIFGHFLDLRAVLFEVLMTVSFYPLVSWLFARAQLALLKSS